MDFQAKQEIELLEKDLILLSDISLKCENLVSPHQVGSTAIVCSTVMMILVGGRVFSETTLHFVELNVAVWPIAVCLGPVSFSFEMRL